MIIWALDAVQSDWMGHVCAICVYEAGCHARLFAVAPILNPAPIPSELPRQNSGRITLSTYTVGALIGM